MVKQSTSSQIYSGTAFFGAIMSDIKAIIGTAIGIIMIIVGIAFEKHKTIYSLLGNGKVYSSNLTPTASVDTDSNGKVIGQPYQSWNGSIEIINDKDTTKTPQTFQINSVRTPNYINPYPVDKSIPIYVNPKDPTDFRLSSDDTSIIGWFFIIIGIIIIISSCVWAYFANKYKIIGAYEGVTTGIDYAKSL